MTLHLPPEMEAWTELMSMFAPDVASGILPLVDRLARLIGPMPAERPKEEGDPEGYRGMVRRGPIHRLLLSEWVLASEFPEEFLRRAVMAEQGYLELAQRSPQGARVCAVCFDASPDVAGMPRVAQVAVLLVLWQRAKRAGAQLRWGFFHNAALFDNVERDSLRVLLTTVQPKLPAEAGAKGWLAACSALGGGPDVRATPELWWVGGARLEGLGLAGNRLILEDPLDAEPDRLEVRLLRPGSRATVTLPMPGVAECVRLVRGQAWGAVRVVAHRKPDRVQEPALGLQWASRSFRLLVRTATTVREYMLEREHLKGASGAASAGERLQHTKFRQWVAPAGEQVVAMDVTRGTAVVVTVDQEHRGWLYGMGRPDARGRGPARWELPEVSLRLPAFGRAAPLCVVRRGGESIWFVDGGGAAWRVSWESGRCVAALVATGITALLGVVEGPLMIRRGVDGFFLESHAAAPPQRHRLRPAEGALLQQGGDDRSYSIGLVHADRVECWQRHTGMPLEPREEPRLWSRPRVGAATAAAVSGLGQHNRLPMMMVKDRCLHWIGASGQVWGMEASGGAIVRACTSGTDRAAAWLDTDGHVTVCALNERGPAGESLRLEEGKGAAPISGAAPDGSVPDGSAPDRPVVIPAPRR